jgi:2-amino-4-hydroxy-6-hydroxymethyldihydropteridine diphosphokinase
VRKTAYLSLGSNQGDRIANLRTAFLALQGLGNITAISSFYETEPVEYVQQPWFVNCAVALETDMDPKQLLTAVLKIEREMGRRRSTSPAKGPRPIDIDILLFGASVMDTPDLTIPHPAMRERRFVLEPLAEIAPDERHPVFQRSIRELLDALPPGQAVRRLFANSE